MRHLITIGIIFIFGIVELVAQSDFRNGYIITNYNDTVSGLLDYKGNKANAKKCMFREDINSENQIFTPKEIKGYRFTNGKYYISKSLNTGDKTKQLFLEYLINGVIDIYYYRGDHGEHYLLDNGTDNLYELKNEEKEIIRNNTLYIKESKEYINILRYTFKDSPSISKRVESIGLNHKSLINITSDYHNEVCSDEDCIIYEKKLPNKKRTFGLLIGLNGLLISEAEVLNDELYYMKNSQFGFEIFPSIGLYYKVNMPFINERLYFQYEGTYSRMNLKTSNSYIEPTYNWNYLNEITLILNSFNSMVIIKYNFPFRKIRPTFHAGGFVNYFFNTEYNRSLEIKYPSGDTHYTNQTNDSPFTKLDYGINCGVGLRSIYLKDKELFFDFRYQRGFGLLQGLNTNTFLINIGLQIGK